MYPDIFRYYYVSLLHLYGYSVNGHFSDRVCSQSLDWFSNAILSTCHSICLHLAALTGRPNISQTVQTF